MSFVDVTTSRTKQVSNSRLCILNVHLTITLSEETQATNNPLPRKAVKLKLRLNLSVSLKISIKMQSKTKISFKKNSIALINHSFVLTIFLRNWLMFFLIN